MEQGFLILNQYGVIRPYSLCREEEKVTLLRKWEVTEDLPRRKRRKGVRLGLGDHQGRTVQRARAVTQPSLGAWMSHGHGYVTAMANSGNDEVLVWVERTLWLQEREEVVRLELEGASHGGGT